MVSMACLKFKCWVNFSSILFLISTTGNSGVEMTDTVTYGGREGATDFLQLRERHLPVSSAAGSTDDGSVSTWWVYPDLCQHLYWCRTNKTCTGLCGSRGDRIWLKSLPLSLPPLWSNPAILLHPVLPFFPFPCPERPLHWVVRKCTNWHFSDTSTSSELLVPTGPGH